MALTITDYIRMLVPNIGLVANPDGSFRIGVEDVNSDEILAELTAILAAVGTPVTAVHTNYTDGGAGEIAIATLAPAAAFQLMGIHLHLSGAVAAAETLTVTKDANAGGGYDTVLYTRDMSVGATVNLVIPFGGSEDYFVDGDQIVIALSANTANRVWGCTTIHRLV